MCVIKKVTEKTVTDFCWSQNSDRLLLKYYCNPPFPTPGPFCPFKFLFLIVKQKVPTLTMCNCRYCHIFANNSWHLQMTPQKFVKNEVWLSTHVYMHALPFPQIRIGPTTFVVFWESNQNTVQALPFKLKFFLACFRLVSHKYVNFVGGMNGLFEKISTYYSWWGPPQI